MTRLTKKEIWKRNIGLGVSKLTPDRVNKLKEAFAIDATVAEACIYAEISERTYYNWVKGNEKLLHEFDAMRQTLPLKAKENIALRIHGKPTLGDIELSKWLIERKESKDSVDTLRLEHTGNISNEPNPSYTIEDDEDPEVKAARENLSNVCRVARQRRAVERNTRLKELQAERVRKNQSPVDRASLRAVGIIT